MDISGHLGRIIGVSIGNAALRVLIAHIVANAPLSANVAAEAPEGVVVFDEIGVVVARVHALHVGRDRDGSACVLHIVKSNAQGGKCVIPPAVEGAVVLDGHGKPVACGNIGAAVHDLGHLINQFGILPLIPCQNAKEVGAHHPHRAVVFQGHDVFFRHLHILHVRKNEGGGGIERAAAAAVAIAARYIVAPEIEVAVFRHRRAGVVVGGGLHHVTHDEIGLVGRLLRLIVALAQLVADVVPPGVQVAVFLDNGQNRAGLGAIGNIAVVVIFSHFERDLKLHRAGRHGFDPGHELHGDIRAGLAVEQPGGDTLAPAVEVAGAGHRPGVPLARLHLPDIGLARRRGRDGQQTGQHRRRQQQRDPSCPFPHPNFLLLIFFTGPHTLFPTKK